MRVKNILFVFTVCFGFISDSLAQHYVCDCCGYPSMEYRFDYVDVMPPLAIAKHGYKEVLVSAISKVSQDSVGGSQNFISLDTLPELRLIFDKKGRVDSRYFYYPESPDPFYVHHFRRNEKGRITSYTFSYLSKEDYTLEKSIWETIIYRYDGRGNLIRLLEQDNILKGMNVETRVKYDKLNRQIKTEKFRSSERLVPSVETNIYYVNDSLVSHGFIIHDLSLYRSEEIQYTTDWKPLIKVERHIQTDHIRSTAYEYDSQGRLVKLEVKAEGEFYTECPDSKGFTDQYFYDNDGLLIRIEHSYNIYMCEMIFQYQ